MLEFLLRFFELLCDNISFKYFFCSVMMSIRDHFKRFPNSVVSGGLIRLSSLLFSTSCPCHWIKGLSSDRFVHHWEKRLSKRKIVIFICTTFHVNYDILTPIVSLTELWHLWIDVRCKEKETSRLFRVLTEFDGRLQRTITGEKDKSEHCWDLSGKYSDS